MSSDLPVRLAGRVVFNPLFIHPILHDAEVDGLEAIVEEADVEDSIMRIVMKAP